MNKDMNKQPAEDLKRGYSKESFPEDSTVRRKPVDPADLSNKPRRNTEMPG